MVAGGNGDLLVAGLQGMVIRGGWDVAGRVEGIPGGSLLVATRANAS